MDYLKSLKNLNAEFLNAGREKYNSLPFILRLICTLVMLPLRVAFVIGRIGYWITWFFFKGFSAPVDYLQTWLNNQKEETGDVTKAVLYLVCLPVIFTYQVYLAFSSFIFFCQWFVLMIYAYVATLGAVRWQPVITEATFNEE